MLSARVTLNKVSKKQTITTAVYNKSTAIVFGQKITIHFANYVPTVGTRILRIIFTFYNDKTYNSQLILNLIALNFWYEVKENS